MACHLMWNTMVAGYLCHWVAQRGCSVTCHLGCDMVWWLVFIFNLPQFRINWKGSLDVRVNETGLWACL